MQRNPVPREASFGKDPNKLLHVRDLRSALAEEVFIHAEEIRKQIGMNEFGPRSDVICSHITSECVQNSWQVRQAYRIRSAPHRQDFRGLCPIRAPGWRDALDRRRNDRDDPGDLVIRLIAAAFILGARPQFVVLCQVALTPRSFHRLASDLTPSEFCASVYESIVPEFEVTVGAGRRHGLRR